MTEGWFKDGLFGGECPWASAAQGCVGDKVSLNEMKCHLSMQRALRADGGQWRWLPGGGDTELASKAGLGRKVGVGIQVAVPWVGGTSPPGASLLGKIFPPPGFISILGTPIWGL